MQGQGVVAKAPAHNAFILPIRCSLFSDSKFLIFDMDAQMHSWLNTLESCTIDNMIQRVVSPNCFLSVVLKKKTYQISLASLGT